MYLCPTPTLCYDAYQDYAYSGSHIQAPIFIFLYSKAVTFQTPTHILTRTFFHISHIIILIFIFLDSKCTHIPTPTLHHNTCQDYLSYNTLQEGMRT